MTKQDLDFILLCDYSWMAHRFGHVHNNLGIRINNEFINTGVIFGFCSFIIALYKRFEGKKFKIIFCKDVVTTERSNLDENYKAQRQSHKEFFIDDYNISAILCILKNISFAYADNKEADDVMALLAIQYSKEYPVWIYTGDNDLLQLKSLNNNIKVTRELTSDNFSSIESDYILKKFGVSDFKYLLKIRSILGDTSDNISAIGSGLRKLFLAEFVKNWESLGYDKALDIKLYPHIKGISNQNIQEHLLLLTKYKELVFKNYALIDLVERYNNKDNEFEIKHYRTKENQYLIQLYELNMFGSFLDYYMALDL